MKENKSFKNRCIGFLARKKVMAVVLSAALCLSVSGTVWAEIRTGIQISSNCTIPDALPDTLTPEQKGHIHDWSIYLHDGVSCIIKTDVQSITGTRHNKNIIIKSGGVVKDNVYGGSESGTGTTISNNSVTIEGGTVKGDVYGGYSSFTAISNNSVTIEDGTVNRNVIGGYSINDDVNGNTVTLEGGTVNGQVIGGFSNISTVSGNTVTLKGGTVNGDVIGGRTETGSVTNNTLHIAGKSLSVGGISGFQNLKLTIPNDMTKSDTLLNITGSVVADFSGMSIDTNNIQIGAMTNLKTGDRITLIHCEQGIGNVTCTGNTCNSPYGEVKCTLTNDSNNLYLVIDDDSRKEEPTKDSDDDIRNSDDIGYTSTSDDEPISRYTLKETAQTAPVTYTPGGNLTTTITTTNGGGDPFDLFRDAQLNGVTLIRGRHYTIKRGSLIISLLPEALKELPEGTNYLTVFFEDGDITIPFNLAELPEGNTKGAPKTGEI